MSEPEEDLSQVVVPHKFTPGVFTERVRVVFLDAIRTGQTMAGAAARAGVSYQTVYNHMNSEPFLVDQIKMARGEAEARLVDSVTKSAHTGETVTTPGGRVTVRPGDWRAAAWLLEHHPETRAKYAAIQKTQLSGDPDNPEPVRIKAKQHDLGELQEVMRALVDGGAILLPPGSPLAMPEPGPDVEQSDE